MTAISTAISRNGNLALMRLALNLVVLAFALILLAFPRPATAQSLRVSQIVVEGNERVDARTIQSYTGISRGQTVSAAELNDAYQRVLASGLFESVAIEPRGGTVVVRVQEFPVILRVNFEGNRRIASDKLREITQTRARRVYNASLVEADARAIAEAYSIEGRLAARVEPRIIRRQGNAVDVVFEIAEGRQTEIERINFVGNRAFTDRRLRNVLSTRQAGLLRAFVSADIYDANRLEVDKQMLTDFYLSRGYLDFQVTDATAEVSRERDGFFVTFTLREGLPYQIGPTRVISEFPGVDAAEFQDLIRIRPNTVYSPTLIENAVARMENLALRKGYDFLRVDPRFKRDDANQILDVTFAIVRGPRIFVERIDIEGNTSTRDDVIRRQFRTSEGDPLNPREIREAAERIRALGLFKTANVDAREGSSADRVIVRAEVEEAPTGSLQFGISYGSAAGVGFTLAFAESNLMGRGQSLDLNLGIGGDYQTSSLRFVEPAFLGRDVRFAVDVLWARNQANRFSPWDSEIIRLQPSLEFSLTQRSRLELRYMVQSSGISDTATTKAVTSDVLDPELGKRSFTSSLGYSWSWDTRRSGISEDTRFLFRLSQDVAGLGGDAKYLKTEALAVAETNVLNGNVTLRAEVEGGALVGFGGYNSRALDRFFLNGKIRGFEPYGIGPRDNNAEANPLGGNFYAVARMEAEFPIGLPERLGIKGGVFFDAGTVWGLDNAAGNDDSLRLRTVAGVSLFWTSPIGPLRFNFSSALNKMPYDREQTFDLTIQARF
jgi:outer membrane protein insertion porin family